MSKYLQVCNYTILFFKIKGDSNSSPSRILLVRKQWLSVVEVQVTQPCWAASTKRIRLNGALACSASFCLHVGESGRWAIQGEESSQVCRGQVSTCTSCLWKGPPFSGRGVCTVVSPKHNNLWATEKKVISFLLCIWVFCQHVCLYNTCIPGAHHRDQNGVSDSPSLELQPVVSQPFRWVLGTTVPWKSRHCSLLMSHLSSP